MNKRIQELIEISGLYIDYDNRAVTVKELEFFAGLIIKDCLDIVEKRTKGPYEITMTAETRNAWNTWIEIKEHFGVKDET
jgi:hypothetical protein